MPATTELIAFAATRAQWQQDLLRKIYTTPAITDEDLSRTLHLLKAEHRHPPLAPVPGPEPLTVDQGYCQILWTE